MQSNQQFEQLMMQYQQLKNGSEDIARMLENEDYDSAITMIKNREQIFISCKTIRRYLELTPEQEQELEKLLNELREQENKNISKLQQNMLEVKKEMKTSQQTKKFQNAYGGGAQSGNFVNIQD